MIRIPELDILTPGSIPELVNVLAAAGGGTRILAGGTDLVPSLKQELGAPKRLIWLGRVDELRRISTDVHGRLTIGAMCTLAEIVASPDVGRCYPSLTDAVSAVASPAIRNRATLGGNLCLDTRCYYYKESESWRIALGGCLKLRVGSDGIDICHAAPGRSICSAVFSSDTAPLLIALDASVRLVGMAGVRTVSLADFYTGNGAQHVALSPAEVLTAVILPSPPPGLRACHRKIRYRASIDYPLVNVGIALQMDSDGVFHRVRILIGAVASAPLRASDAERVLEGKQATKGRIEEASEKAAAMATPVANVTDNVRYQRKMVQVLVRRVLAELTEM